MSRTDETRTPRLVVSLLLVLAVALIYGQVRDHEFLNFDDDIYITGNPMVTGTPSWTSIKEAFGIRANNWHPLTWLSHLLDWRLFGPWAGGHLLVNASLHALNALVLLGLLTAATGAFWSSAVVAALFAVHPLRVESVAWAAERKDVLSALFWLLTTWAYVRHARRPSTGRFVGVHVLFLLGCAAKPTLVTLPFTLLLLDWWPLGRTSLAGRQAGRPSSRSWPELVREKSLLFALSVAISLVTLYAQTSGVVSYERQPLASRVGNAVVSYAHYLLDLAWPRNLACIYPYPSQGVSLAALAAAAVLIGAITATALRFRREQPWLSMGWFWHLGTLVPMIGLVQVGAQARADRYTYIALLGATIAIVWSVARALPRRPVAAAFTVAAVGAILAWYSWSSWNYVGVWRNSLTLMASAAAATDDNYVALNNLGTALLDAGRTAESLPVLQEAARIKPDFCDAQYNLGEGLTRLSRYREAYAPLAAALECYRALPRLGYVVDTEVRLGDVSLGLGLPAEAIRHFRAALHISPADPRAQEGLSRALSSPVP